MITAAESDGEVGNTHAGGIAGQARVMSVSLKKLVKTCSASGATLAFINQIRTGMPSTPFEKMKGITQETTPGGKALKFYASMRIKFTKVTGVKGKVFDPVQGIWEEGIVATKVRAEVVKNKMAPPFRRTEFIIRYGIGIDDVMSFVMVAIARKTLPKSGGYITIPAKYHASGTDTKINGLENVCNYFRRDYPPGFTLLEGHIRDLISKDLDSMEADYQADTSDADFDEVLLHEDTDE
jgi:recombination protein RecA